MILDVLWIIGFYIAAAAVAHRVFRRSPDPAGRHYVLVAGNHQSQIEWYLRSLQHFSVRTGTDIGITIVLENSTDDTGLICERFSRSSAEFAIIRRCQGPQLEGTAADTKVKGFSRHWMARELETEQPGSEVRREIVWVDLGNREDVSRLPL